MQNLGEKFTGMDGRQAVGCHQHLPLVIVDNFHTERVPVFKPKAEPPLIVDADAPLSSAVVLERFQPI
ncbi:MAG: hypothetical protein R2854_13735 [Caldilineaceae bacterium]